MDSVSLLLACPRGRRFCANVASVADTAAEFALNPHTDADPVRALADLDPTVVTGLSESDLLAALGRAVDFARYWQPPDDADLLYARFDVVQALHPVADAALAAPHAAWWGEPIDREHQCLTSYFDRDESWTDWPLHHRHDDRDLLRWREHVLANESRFHEHYAAMIALAEIPH